MDINGKIAVLREVMKEEGIKAYIIPSNDPHMSEYVSDHWKSRAYFSGFTGSAGTLVVTEKNSGLWTDGRYYIQAEAQLKGSEIQLFKMGEKSVPSFVEYLTQEMKAGSAVGLDGKLFSVATVKSMEKAFKKKKLTLRSNLDLVERIWKDRPTEVLTSVYLHDQCFTGRSCKEKLMAVRKELKTKHADAYVISELASIAWLFNIRANDICYNPMAIAYAYITLEKAYLCIETSRLPLEASMKLKAEGVEIKKYDEIENLLQSINKPTKVFCSVHTLNDALYRLLEKNLSVKIIEGEEIIIDLKAIKNEVEIQNIRIAHIKDGCALVEFMVEFEKRMKTSSTVTEYDLVSMLKEARGKQAHNVGESFASIIAYKENAAMMHYAPTSQQHKVLNESGLLLIDSGGQYLEGTTDITRTFALGEVTNEEKRHYTLVLKSHIAMAKAVFMEGTTGGNLDILAREPIWSEGIDYKCGTGHGVGFMLGVHEGPQSLRMTNHVPLKLGMLITNEPGIYIEGKHGIRTENILIVQPCKETDYGTFYQFETVTYFPIDTAPIDLDLLTLEEKEWLNQYHALVYERLSPFLKDEALQWLEVHTRPI